MKPGMPLRMCAFFLCAWMAAAAEWPSLRFVRAYNGLVNPTSIGHAGDGSGRLFFTEQAGRVRVARGGSLLTRPFLDIAGRVSCCGERGLLSVAFPPGYSSKNYFYVYYTAINGDVTVSRFSTTSDPDLADPATEAVLLRIPHPVGNHNGGQLAFGPDGYLYIGTGDGGGAGDTQGNAQNLSVALGKILRIDVEAGTQPYRTPGDNPFTNNASARPEIWAYGLRNPWRFSFDRQTRDLYIADVGQNQWEEVNFQPGGDRGGQNYGWNITEGNHCYSGICTFIGLTMPVAEYGHGLGCSVTGGYAYRGRRYAAWRGVYFYADYCSGRVWGLQRVNAEWQSSLLASPGYTVTTFGEDEGGEVYLADGPKGDIYALAATPATAEVVNAASGVAGISPGSIATLRGSGLSTVSESAIAPSGALPTTLAGTSLTVNGTAAPLIAIINDNGREYINFQAPYALAGTANADIVVTVNGVAAQSVRVPVAAVQPGIFTLDGTHAAAQHPETYRVVNSAEPATAGEIVLFYGTGLGPLDNPPQTGQPAPVSPLARVPGTVRVTIGGLNADVFYAGLAPGLVGVYQVNARVPDGIPAGDADVVIAVGEAASPAVKLPVR